ncbi:hypothetical protein HCN44_003438 [Aphidius gifuensis]|uniref:Uncharacterized protein n=1 Tax=Aphidius gifuensis TaxID=684658 RepID=A0A835CNZ0_APHGI|nr:hypothetical protein HCN44_003438 [Aphidius gifuensis]
MYMKTLLFVINSFTLVNANFFSFARYAKYIYPENLTTSAASNQLWTGILKDCSEKLSFSCIQKNAYSYLDDSLVEQDNITVFDGFVLRKNNLVYDSCTKNCKDDFTENLIRNSKVRENIKEDIENKEEFYEDIKSPLEEITEALREKTVKFLSTRDYEIELPRFMFDNSRIKISPREIDENGALVRIDFGERNIERQGRLFKKIRKFIQNRLLMSFFALLLIIKLIKVKFAFIIPFLFGAAVSKKIFLKLLLFLVPAFAHVFKLCSAYYSSHTKSHHHHHHQIAHHHHHVPVPVPVPTYVDHHHSPSLASPSHHEEEFEGYDYANPHLQIRKDMEELKEWGIDTFAESHDEPSLRPVETIGGSFSQSGPVGRLVPQPGPIEIPPSYPTNFGPPQYPVVQKPNTSYGDKFPANIPLPGQSLAYNGYLDEQKLNRRIFVPSVLTHSQGQTQSIPNTLKPAPSLSAGKSSIIKSSSAVINPIFTQPTSTVQAQHVVHDDNFYGPMLEKIDGVFAQLRFVEEICRERLVCSMYKNPERFSPHSNHVSNELSRNPQELKHGENGSVSSQRFHRYLEAARLGQDNGDCLRSYPCHMNTE